MSISVRALITGGLSDRRAQPSTSRADARRCAPALCVAWGRLSVVKLRALRSST